MANRDKFNSARSFPMNADFLNADLATVLRIASVTENSRTAGVICPDAVALRLRASVLWKAIARADLSKPQSSA